MSARPCDILYTSFLNQTGALVRKQLHPPPPGRSIDNYTDTYSETGMNNNKHHMNQPHSPAASQLLEKLGTHQRPKIGRQPHFTRHTKWMLPLFWTSTRVSIENQCDMQPASVEHSCTRQPSHNGPHLVTHKQIMAWCHVRDTRGCMTPCGHTTGCDSAIMQPLQNSQGTRGCTSQVPQTPMAVMGCGGASSNSSSGPASQTMCRGWQAPDSRTVLNIMLKRTSPGKMSRHEGPSWA